MYRFKRVSELCELPSDLLGAFLKAFMLNKKIIGGIVALLIAYYWSNRNSCSKKEGKLIHTNSGTVKGIISLSRDGREFYEWLGIPYAKPPIGPLRFATPQPLDKEWDGVRAGSAYGSVCAQMHGASKTMSGNEDCLFLNIHAPKKEEKTNKLLPVLFWIHGGAFMAGSSNQYRPNYFMDEDVILVTINYRLGALGFLSTGDGVIRGNMGLKDQSLALKWVHENIVHFGGDPKQITIFGESAGSGCVHHHLLSPMSKGLIHRAISQSGSALNMWSINEDPLSQAKKYAKILNCPIDSTSQMADCLRNLDVNTLLKIHEETGELIRTKDTYTFPVVETIIDQETFMPDEPINLLNSGQFSKVPWLAGYNKDEGLVYSPGILTRPEYRKVLEENWDTFADSLLFLNEAEKEHSVKIQEFYFGSWKEVDLEEKYKSVTELLTDRWFAYGMQKAARIQSKYAPVQFYYYNKIGPTLFDLLIMIKGNYPPIIEFALGTLKNWFNSFVLRQPKVSYGVCHGDDLAMLFHKGLDIFNVPKGSQHYEFSKDLVKAWVSYASLPNVEQAEFRGTKFPLVSSKGEVQVLEISDEPRIISFPISERIQFWESLEY